MARGVPEFKLLVNSFGANLIWSSDRQMHQYLPCLSVHFILHWAYHS